MKILKECKQFLSYAGLGTEKYVNIGGKRIPRAMIRAIPITMLAFGSILQSINSINNYHHGLLEVLLPFHSCLHFVVKCAVYCALLWETNQISWLIGYIEMVIQRRMCLALFFYFFVYGKVNVVNKMLSFVINHQQDAIYQMIRTPFMPLATRMKNE